MDQFIETLGVYNTVSQQLTESVFFLCNSCTDFLLYTNNKFFKLNKKNNRKNNKNETDTRKPALETESKLKEKTKGHF